MGTSTRWPRDDYREAMFECPHLDPYERAVANVYAEYAKSGIEAWVVTVEMTRRTGIESRSTITKVTARLVKKGWLVRVKRGTPHRAGVYCIAIPDDCPDDTHKSGLCPSKAHKGPGDNSGLVSTRGAQAGKALVSTTGAHLVSISGAQLVSTRGAQSVQYQSSNQSSAREQNPGLVEAVLLVSTELGRGLDESQEWIEDKIRKASKPPHNLIGFVRSCIASEQEAKKTTGNVWLDGKAATSKGGPPPIGTRGDTNCRRCYGSGLLEDDEGRPTGQTCPDCVAVSA